MSSSSRRSRSKDVAAPVDVASADVPLPDVGQDVEAVDANPVDANPADADDPRQSSDPGPPSDCGNGVLDPEENCDESASVPCPIGCPASTGCQVWTLVGSKRECSARCESAIIADAVDGDGCCPAGSTFEDDLDCESPCGNGKLDPEEKCDDTAGVPCPGACPPSSGCQLWALVGTAADCSAQCESTVVKEAVNGDGCCPPDASFETDDDCDAPCGDGALGSGELCDDSAGAPCPTSCLESDACTSWALQGSAEECNAQCVVTAMAPVGPDDDCCPKSGTPETDPDCVVECGNGIEEAGEQCDGGVGDAECADFGLGADTVVCETDCTLSTLGCASGHQFEYTSIGNIWVVDDLHRVRWHPDGDFALLLGRQGIIARYDAGEAGIGPLLTLNGVAADLAVTVDGTEFVVVGEAAGVGTLWRLAVAADTTVTKAGTESLPFGSPRVISRHPTGVQMAIGARAKAGTAYAGHLYRWTPDEGILGAKSFPTSAGLTSVMWAAPSLFSGSDALITAEGGNGAGSHTWVIDSDQIVSNGWSPAFGNPTGASWRPGGVYGLVGGGTSNVVYVYDGAWQKTSLPGVNNGARVNAIAWNAQGTRALLVGRPTGSPVAGTVFEHRPTGEAYDASALHNQSIPGFSGAPWNGSFNTHLLDVAWRPNSPCDEGLIVGMDNGTSFNPTFGMVIRFHDPDDPSCN